MYYYISVDIEDLAEVFITESISSPAIKAAHTFNRVINPDTDLQEYLILTKSDRGGDYSIKIDSFLLDDALLYEYRNGNKLLYFYPKTIYLKRNYCSVRFSSEDLYNHFLQYSKIGNIESKCVEKYKEDFYIEYMKEDSLLNNIPKSEVFLKINDYIKFDNWYNRIKGALVACSVGQMSSRKINVDHLLYDIGYIEKDLLYLIDTAIQKNHIIEEVDCYIYLLSNYSEVFKEVTRKNIHNFDVIKVLFTKINNIITLKINAGSSLQTNKSLLDALSLRIKNNFTTIIKRVNKFISDADKVNLDAFKITQKGSIDFTSPWYSKAEIDFFNIILNKIRSIPIGTNNFNVQNLVIQAARDFKNKKSSHTKLGILLLESLRIYWKYIHNRIKYYTLPIELPIFCSVLAFLLHSSDFKEMQLFMAKNDIVDKQFGYMLLGAYLGYAYLPRTLTWILYDNPSYYVPMDDYLFNITKKIKF